ncbi:MAG: phosphate ABC transporter ATP-binding protein PstB [Saprospiraceae bacterium]|nr:phosphate ABC transporter ATP-binding protein PstB [Saprospiraceae bacterium]MDW8485315.1 phosphate ABC transporter ATP-binding protein PstB [Saprospiraceae bacterium]
MEEQHCLQIEKLHVYAGAKHILKGISLNLPRHQIIALIGPSGCGKTMLLRSINRMHDLDPNIRLQGSILFKGRNILDPRVDPVWIRRHIGMVFQKPNPFAKSIFENVAYGLKINGLKDKARIRAIVEESLRRSYLWEEVKDELDKSALELSGGQQQRLCLARAIAVSPEVILLDEPCSALDPISTAKVEETLLSLRQMFTILIVTHNLQQARRISDYTAFLYLGELVEYGPTAQMFEQPQQELTYNYLHGRFG